MRLTTFFLIFSLVVLFGCKRSTYPLFQQFDEVVPYGTWVYSGHIDSVLIYYYAEEFEEDNSGIAFESGNVYIERTSGWCGTPPLSYANIEGKWEIMDHNILIITCPDCSWMDENNGRLMEIVDRSKTELRVIFRNIPE
jgi:hypothetical protein